MALLIKLNNCNKLSLQSYITKFYRKLEKNGVNISSVQTIELSDIKLCEGLIHQNVMTSANILNWVDFKLTLENKQVTLTIQSSPFLETLCNPINVYNRISLNSFECSTTLKINQSFSLAADLEDFYFLNEGRFKYFIFNQIDFKLLIDKNYFYQLSQTSEVSRNNSPVYSPPNGAFRNRSSTQTSVNPIDQLCERQNRLRISSSSSNSSRSFPSPRNNTLYHQDSFGSLRGGSHHRGHRSPRQYRGPRGTLPHRGGTLPQRGNRSPVPPPVPPRSREEAQIQDIQIQNPNNSNSPQENSPQLENPVLPDNPILPEMQERAERIVNRADRLLNVAEDFLRTSENAESPEVQSLLEEYDNNPIQYNLRPREQRSSLN